jgi:hypothetical protein
VKSPLLTVHLRARKQVKRGKNKPKKDIIKFNLLSDGIHPSPLLAKVWLKEISMRISVDTFVFCSQIAGTQPNIKMYAS